MKPIKKAIKNSKILIIEDSELATSLGYIFEDLDVKDVQKIHSIVQSKMIDIDSFDLILMDLNLLDSKSPEEVFSNISKNCDVNKIVIVSGMDNLDLWAISRNVKFLCKPFDYQDLMSIVKEYFSID